MLSVLWSIKFFITPMRSSKACCMRDIWSCKPCTWVCNWTISLLTAKLGAALASASHAANPRK